VETTMENSHRHSLCRRKLHLKKKGQTHLP